MSYLRFLLIRQMPGGNEKYILKKPKNMIADNYHLCQGIYHGYLLTMSLELILAVHYQARVVMCYISHRQKQMLYCGTITRDTTEINKSVPLQK